METAKRMTSKLITVAPQDALAKAKALMDSGNFRPLPVLEDGRLIGILSDRDLRLHSGHLDSTRVDAVMDVSSGYHHTDNDRRRSSASDVAA